MKRLLFSIVLILCGLGLRAQSTFELGLHGGVAGWNSRHTYISMQPGANVGLHAAYGYYSQHVIGFRIGVTADNTSFPLFCSTSSRNSFIKIFGIFLF